MSGLSPARDNRQSSEPRSLPFEGRQQGRGGGGGELPMKPPMGPRGGRGSKPNQQSLPPRFQKMQAAAAGGDDWDGNKSLVFQGGHAHTLPHPSPKQQQRRQDDHRQQQGRNARSATPDQFKRPKTPPQQGGRGRRPSPSERRTPSQDWSGSGRRSPFGMRRTPSQESVGRRRGGKNRNRYLAG